MLFFPMQLRRYSSSKSTLLKQCSDDPPCSLAIPKRGDFAKPRFAIQNIINILR